MVICSAKPARTAGAQDFATFAYGAGDRVTIVRTRPGADEDGFKWVVWPYSLDNGSPGVWQSQDFGEKAHLDTFPRGVAKVGSIAASRGPSTSATAWPT